MFLHEGKYIHNELVHTVVSANVAKQQDNGCKLKDIDLQCSTQTGGSECTCIYIVILILHLSIRL